MKKKGNLVSRSPLEMGVENRRKSLCSFRRGLLGILVLTPLPHARGALEAQDARGALEAQGARGALEGRGALEVQDDVRRASGGGGGGR